MYATVFSASNCVDNFQSYSKKQVYWSYKHKLRQESYFFRREKLVLVITHVVIKFGAERERIFDVFKG